MHWKCFLHKGARLCGFETKYTLGNSSNMKATHTRCSGAEHMSEARIAQGRSPGGGWFGAANMTMQKLLKLKTLFVLVCMFNFLSCGMAHNDISKQWTYKKEQSFSALHKLVFGRIAICIYMYLHNKTWQRLKAVLAIYSHPFMCGLLDHWTSKHIKMGFAVVDI